MTSFMWAAGAAMLLLFPIRAAIKFETAMVDVRKSVDGLENSKALSNREDRIFRLSKELSMVPVQVAALASSAG